MAYFKAKQNVNAHSNNRIRFPTIPHPHTCGQELWGGCIYPRFNLIYAIPYQIMLSLTEVAFNKFQSETKQSW